MRGLRIELNDIESNLLNINGIQKAVVILQTIHQEDQLVAYYVAEATSETDAVILDDSQLRHQLKTQLPEYMLPFCFIPLEHFPLSANGKLDRKQLPRAEDLISTQPRYVAPENETETIVAGFFAELLGIEQVGIHDNFFLLGGHSLIATKLAAKIRRHFDCQFELKLIFDHPTVH